MPAQTGEQMSPDAYFTMTPGRAYQEQLKQLESLDSIAPFSNEKKFSDPMTKRGTSSGTSLPLEELLEPTKQPTVRLKRHLIASQGEPMRTRKPKESPVRKSYEMPLSRNSVIGSGSVNS